MKTISKFARLFKLFKQFKKWCWRDLFFVLW